jgi:GT2 family glycosyltransferase
LTPNTDIVIPIRLTKEFAVADAYFSKCISSLREYTHNFRPIFVDDNSDVDRQRDIEAAAELFPSSILVRTHKQRWFTRAINLGLSLARTTWVVTLNCDVVLNPGWLEELYTLRDLFVQQNKRVGLVGSVFSESESRRFEECRHPGYVTGHAVLQSIYALHDVANSRGTPGIFYNEIDPLMIHIRSDVEICYRMMSLGWTCVSAFKSYVGHEAGKTWGHLLHRIPNSLEVVNDRYDKY